MNEYELQRRELSRLLGSASTEDKRQAIFRALEKLETQRDTLSHNSEGNGGGSGGGGGGGNDDDEILYVGSDDSKYTQERIPLCEDNVATSDRSDLNNFEAPTRARNRMHLGESKISSPLSSQLPHQQESSQQVHNNRAIENIKVPPLQITRPSPMSTVMGRSEQGNGAVEVSLPNNDTTASTRRQPVSARPGSARRRSTLELRTIPENSPFIRPLSGAAKLKQKQSYTQQEVNEIVNGSSCGASGVMRESSVATRNILIGGSSLGSRFSNGAWSSSYPVPQSPQCRASGVSSGASPKDSTSAEKHAALRTAQNGSINPEHLICSTSSPCQFFAEDVEELRIPDHIMAVWASCVDPARPPFAVLVDSDFQCNTELHDSKVVLQNSKYSAVRGERLIKGKNGAVSSMTALAAMALSEAIERLKQSSRLSGYRPCWITTGSFPQILRVQLCQPVVLKRVQLFVTGSPTLVLRAASPLPCSPKSASKYSQPTRNIEKKCCNELHLNFAVIDSAVDAEAVMHYLELRDPPYNTKAVHYFDLHFQDARDHFCAVSRLRIWAVL